MDTELYALLCAVNENTYHFVLDGEPEKAIVYRMTTLYENVLESGGNLGTVYYYNIVVKMKAYDLELISDVVETLKTAGWKIMRCSQEYDTDLHYYQYVINTSYWKKEELA